MPQSSLRSVLVVNLKSLPTWHLDLAHAFRALGIDSACFITTPQTVAERFDKSVRGRKWYESGTTLARLHATCREQRPELVILLGMFVVPTRVAETLARGLDPSPRIVGWLCDCFAEPQFSPWQPAAHTFYFDTWLERSLPRYYPDPARRSYLPLAASPERYRPLASPTAAKRDALLFVGNVSPNRATVLNAIGDKLPLAVHGPNAARVAPVAGHDERRAKRPHGNRRNRRRKLDSAAINALYNDHRVVLNINQAPNTEHGLNLRVFEATAAGATLLTQDCADLARHFDAGHELLAWRDTADLVDTCRAALADPRRCEQIAARGRERVLAEHTFVHRARTMLDVLT